MTQKERVGACDKKGRKGAAGGGKGGIQMNGCRCGIMSTANESLPAVSRKRNYSGIQRRFLYAA